MEVSEKIKLIIKVSGLTQEALASRVGVSFASLNAWVNGRAQPRRGALREIERIFIELAIGSPLSARALFADALDLSHRDQKPSLTVHQTGQLLGGGGDAEVIDILRDGQHITFLKTLVSIVETLPEGALAEALSLLDAAKDVDGDACKQALTYPLVGVWAASTLRRALGVTHEGSIDDDIGHFSTVAAATAWKSGVQNFSIDVPVRNGGVVLPGMGRAAFENADGVRHARLTCNDGEICIATDAEAVAIPSDPTSGTYQWEPIRTLRASCEGLDLTLLIDDLDPYRAEGWTLLSPVKPARLDQLDLKTWKENVTDAWEMLVKHHREYAKGIARGMQVIVPVEDDVRHVTAYFRDGFGAIISTVGPSSAWTAQGLLEEFQRMKLHAWHGLQTLHVATSDRPGYMVLNSDAPNTFDGVIEAFYSTPATAAYWEVRLDHAHGEEEPEAAVNTHLRHSWEEFLFNRLQASGELTSLGRRMLETIHHQSSNLQRNIPPEVIDLVRKTLIDHRLCFRMTNVVSRSDDIERLARVWATGMACPVDESVRQYIGTSRPQVLGRGRRRKLSQLRSSHPEKFHELMDNEHFLNLVIPGASVADACVVAGRFDEAGNRYQAAIAKDTDDAEAWTGLALVSALQGSVTASTLGRLPEVVAELHRCLHDRYGRSEDPLLLATWLEPLLLRMDDFTWEGESASASASVIGDHVHES